jgi:hypothetical protein
LTVEPVGTTPNPETVDFLARLFAPCDDGWVTLFAAHPDGRREPKWEPTAQAANLAKVAACLEGWNVWFGCATRKQRLNGGRRGGKDDCAHIVGLWVDVDIKGPGHAALELPDEDQAYNLINEFPLPPTVIVHSGHGLQAWWALQEPHEIAGSDLLTRWGATWARRSAEAGHHLDNVFDAPRIMRLPGTVNHKPGCDPAPVTIVHDDWRNRYGEDDIDQWLDPAPEPVVNHHGIPYIGPGRPGDAYNARHTCEQLLQGLGFIPGRADRDGNQHWKWPASAGDQSATTYPDGHCAIWSETAAAQLGARTQHGYDPYGLYVDTQHHGNHTTAARHLAANGYGTPPAQLADIIGTPPAEPSRWLPDHFWNARPYLNHIRQAAWSRTTSPDAVLAAVLARVSANTNHQLAIPPIVGSAGSLNFYAAIIAPSGAGKSTGMDIAEELVPPSILDDTADGIPLGSGEGLAEAFMGEKTEDDENGKPKKIRTQIRHNAFVIVDEGAAITAMMDRSGTTILEALRRGWTGQTLGQANASTDRRRIVNNYRLGLIVAFQPELAGRLLADHHAGTPQRFIYTSGTDPNIPDQTPEWPGPLHIPTLNPADLHTHEARTHKHNGIHLGIDEQIAATLRHQQRDKARGTRTVNELDSHEPLHRLKTASLLAILDGRIDITTDDWALADTIWTTSCAVRAWLAATSAKAETAALEAKAIRRAQTGIIEEEHRATHDERRAKQLATNIARHVHNKAVTGGEWENGATARDLSHLLASRDRSLADVAIQTALVERLITPAEGDQTGRFMPGPNRPA